MKSAITGPRQEGHEGWLSRVIERHPLASIGAAVGATVLMAEIEGIPVVSYPIHLLTH